MMARGLCHGVMVRRKCSSIILPDEAHPDGSVNLALTCEFRVQYFSPGGRGKAPVQLEGVNEIRK